MTTAYRVMCEWCGSQCEWSSFLECFACPDCHNTEDLTYEEDSMSEEDT
jgi:hypothetical protein